jgi:hypothetical protein
MRRVWVFALIAVLAVSAVVAGSAGYLYLSDAGVTDDKPSEPEKTGKKGVESITSDEVEDEYPTEQRYVSVYKQGEPPEWIPESKFSMENHRAGTYEVTRYPNAEPTEEQLNAAWKLYNKSFEAAKENGWFEFEEAVEDGYRKEGAPRHWTNVNNLSIHTEENNLNPSAPETLVYYQNPQNVDNRILAGYMYHKPIGSTEEGEQIAGPMTVWHYHPQRTANYADHLRKLIDEIDSVNSSEELFNSIGSEFDNVSEYAEKRDRTAEMIHVWFVEHPEGPFGTSMSVPASSLRDNPEKISKDEFETRVMKNTRFSP